MLYSEKYATQMAARVTPGYHQDYIETDVQVDPVDDIWMTGRYARCFVCRAVTEFRDLSTGLSIAICGEECRSQSSEWSKEDAPSDLQGLRPVEILPGEDGDLPPSDPL